MLFTSCNNKEHQAEEKPIYNTPTQASAQIASPVPTQKSNNTKETLESLEKEYEYFVGFNGVTSTKDTPKSANSPFSNSYGKMRSIITYNQETDTLYYTNFEKDNFLYSYKEDKSELLIEMPVNFPNYSNGNIYFLSNSENLPGYYDMWCGKLYKYNLENKTIELLFDQNVYNLSVYDDYLYFSEEIYLHGDDLAYKLGCEYFKYSISTGLIEKIGDLLPFFYGEYQLSFTPRDEDGLFAINLISDIDNINLTGYYYYTNHTWADGALCIADDKFWFKCTLGLVSINLNNGETKIYKGNDEKDKFSFDYMTGIENFAVLNGELYVTSNFRLFRYDYESDKFISINPEKGLIQFIGVYTDGEYIYSIKTDGLALSNNHTSEIIKFIPGSDGSFEEVVINK